MWRWVLQVWFAGAKNCNVSFCYRLWHGARSFKLHCNINLHWALIFMPLSLISVTMVQCEGHMSCYCQYYYICTKQQVAFTQWVFDQPISNCVWLLLMIYVIIFNSDTFFCKLYKHLHATFLRCYYKKTRKHAAGSHLAKYLWSMYKYVQLMILIEITIV